MLIIFVNLNFLKLFVLLKGTFRPLLRFYTRFDLQLIFTDTLIFEDFLSDFRWPKFEDKHKGTNIYLKIDTW